MCTSASQFGKPEPENRETNSVDPQPTHAPEAPSSLDSAESSVQTTVPPADPPATRSIRQRKRPSHKRIEANRRNAKRSTGPRTARGKKVVSRNARKHGLLAREVVITAGDGRENQEEFDALHRKVWEHYAPAGIPEEIQADILVSCYWRLARTYRAETGEIRRELDSTERDVRLARAEEVGAGMFMQAMMHPEATKSLKPWFDSKVSMYEKARSLVKYQNDMRKTPEGNLSFARVLLNAKRELTESGAISSEVYNSLVSVLGLCCPFLMQVLCELGPSTSTTQTEDLANTRALAIALIDVELINLRAFADELLESESNEASVQKQIRSLPTGERADKIIRYESHLLRQLYRAIDELERLQRRRMGEAVPPPLAVRFN